MTLWSDDKTKEDIQKLSETDSDSVVYNLHEDLLCVKEELAKANERVAIYNRGINKAIEALEREDDSSAYDAISYLENVLQLRKEQDGEQ